MCRYTELKKEEPVLNNCFWAFNKSQFEEGLQKFNLDITNVIQSWGGLYGTKEGLDSMFKFYEDLRLQIKQECTPQMIYDYEFFNHECEYTGDDQEAIEKVFYYFNDEFLPSAIIRK